MNTNFNEVELAAAIRALDRANAHFEAEFARIDAQIDETLRFTEDILAKYPGYDAARQAEGPDLSRIEHCRENG